MSIMSFADLPVINGTDSIPVKLRDIIKILEYRSPSQDLVGYYTFGHIAKPAFAKAVGMGISDNAVQHIYWAEGYDPEDDDCIRRLWLPAKACDEGAIEITFVSLD